MQLNDYLLAVGLGSLAVLGPALPFLAATAVALWPGNRPQWKWRFVLACAVVVYGVSGVFGVFLLPFQMFGIYISPQLQHNGHHVVPSIVSWIHRVADVLPYIVVAVGSFAIPVLGRRGAWARLCAGMTSKLIQPTCEDASG